MNWDYNIRFFGNLGRSELKLTEFRLKNDWALIFASLYISAPGCMLFKIKRLYFLFLELAAISECNYEEEVFFLRISSALPTSIYE